MVDDPILFANINNFMLKTFVEWLKIREMAGGGPYIAGSVNRKKHSDFQVWGAPPAGDGEVPARKKSKKNAKKL